MRLESCTRSGARPSSRMFVSRSDRDAGSVARQLGRRLHSVRRALRRRWEPDPRPAGCPCAIVSAAMLVWTGLSARSTSAVAAASVRDLSPAACRRHRIHHGRRSGIVAHRSCDHLDRRTHRRSRHRHGRAGRNRSGWDSHAARGGALLACTAVLLARLGRQNGVVPRWITATAWATAVTLCLGVSVGLLLPFGLWAIVCGLVWRAPPSGRTAHECRRGSTPAQAP